MEKRKTLVAMQHALQPAQSQELSARGYTLADSSAFNELKAELSNLKFDANLHRLANEFVSILEIEGFNAVVLPIGSPAFCFVLSNLLADTKIAVLFAHSERIVTANEDGTKTVQFEHQGFIRL